MVGKNRLAGDADSVHTVQGSMIVGEIEGGIFGVPLESHNCKLLGWGDKKPPGICSRKCRVEKRRVVMKPSFKVKLFE